MNSLIQKITPRTHLVVTLVLALLTSLNTPSVLAATGKTPPPTPIPTPIPVTTTTTALTIPSGIGFPTTVTAGSAPITLTYALINTGTIPLLIDTIGPLTAPLTINSAGPGLCSSGLTLPTGTGTPLSPTGVNVCLINLTLTPTTVGAVSQFAPITFLNAPAGTPIGIATSIISADPVFQVASQAPSPTDTPLGLSSTNETIFFHSAGAQPLVINNISFSGANPGDFARGLYQQNCGRCSAQWPDCKLYGDPISVPTFGYCALSFKFVPTDIGPRSATVTFTTNDPANPIQTYNLAGNGIPALIPPPPVSAFNVTDMWATPAENGWKLSVIHHQKIGSVGSDVIDATFITFDVNDVPTWFTVKNGSWTSSTTYTGEVHQIDGTYFGNAYSATDTMDTIVGTATLSFVNANNGAFTYTINGITVTKTITRTVF